MIQDGFVHQDSAYLIEDSVVSTQGPPT